jgi:beta-fructofuranosidase
VLRLPNDWVWDSWIADDGEQYHLFFLKAPRSLKDPALRHTAATIEHATSPGLVRWTLQADALLPAPRGGWDDLALWTGSVLRGDDGVWRLYYTALSSARRHGVRDQRIGSAESDDLFEWRHAGDQPLVCPDQRWYKTLDDDASASDSWRDPFVFKDPRGDGWHMLITARARGAPRLRDGVLAHARSPSRCEPTQVVVSRPKSSHMPVVLSERCRYSAQPGCRTSTRRPISRALAGASI